MILTYPPPWRCWLDGDLGAARGSLTYWVVQAEQLVVLVDLTWARWPTRPDGHRDGPATQLARRAACRR